MLCCGHVCLGVVLRGVVGRSYVVHHVQITTVTTRDAKLLGVGRSISPLLCLPDILCCGIMTLAHVQQHHQRKALDQAKQVNPQPTTRLAKKKAQKAVNKEAAPKDPGPRASPRDRYRPSKALETGRAEKGLWSMIPEVNRYCCVVMWPCVFGHWCTWCCGLILCGAPFADNDGGHKGCKALVDTLQTHIMACSNALPLCLAYVGSGREALKTIVLDMDNTLLVAWNDHDGVSDISAVLGRVPSHASWASSISRGHVPSLQGAGDRQVWTSPMEHDPRNEQVLLCCDVAWCVWALECVLLLAVSARYTICR